MHALEFRLPAPNELLERQRSLHTEFLRVGVGITKLVLAMPVHFKVRSKRVADESSFHRGQPHSNSPSYIGFESASPGCVK